MDCNAVEEFKIGNTTIKIYDDYCVKTQEEIDAIIEHISKNAQRALNSQKEIINEHF